MSRVTKRGGKVIVFWPHRFATSAAVLDSVHFVNNCELEGPSMNAQAVMLGLLLCACANPLHTLHQRRTVALDGAQVTVAWGHDDDQAERQVTKALTRALPELNRWGGLTSPVTLSVLPTHEALEQVTGRSGYGWLRAWGRYDEVWLQSPRTWPHGTRDSDLIERLTHELTHCLLFQRSATAATWEQTAIPFWFREGMATVTARQGYLFASLEDLARWQTSQPTLDVFEQGEAISVAHFDQAYGVSHHAMTFFLKRYTDEALLAVMRAMSAGQAFDRAFVTAIGLTPAAFAREFNHYLRWRGFRGFGLPVRPKP